MKTPLPILPLLAAAALFPGAVRAGTPMDIPNPGFERETTDWTFRYDYNLSQTTAEAAHSGNFGLRMTDDNPAKGGSAESLAIGATPGREYEVTFWARTVSGDGGGSVALRFLDENGKSLQKKMPRVAIRQTPEWTQFSFKARAPQNTAALSIWARSIATETATIDYDDFACQELPVTPAP